MRGVWGCLRAGGLQLGDSTFAAIAPATCGSKRPAPTSRTEASGADGQAERLLGRALVDDRGEELREQDVADPRDGLDVGRERRAASSSSSRSAGVRSSRSRA